MAAPAPLADEDAGALAPFIPHCDRQPRALIAVRPVRRGASLSAALDWLADRVVLFRHGDLVFVPFGLFAALGSFLTLAWMGVILIGQGISVGAFVTLALVASALVVLGSWLLAQLLDFRNSGDTAGTKSRVVGYSAIAFHEPSGSESSGS